MFYHAEGKLREELGSVLNSLLNYFIDSSGKFIREVRV